MTSYLKEHKDKIFIIIIFILIFLFLLSKIMVQNVSNLDELWNYNIARNIAKGLTPYKDISLITTPFLPILEAIVIKITSDELIIFRVLNAMLITGILFFSYRVLFKLNNNRLLSSIFVLGFIPLLGNDLFLDYNFFILFLTLIIINLECTNNDKKSAKTDFFIGILGGLAFCTKQTVGAVICIEILAFQLIKSYKEKNFKKLFVKLVGEILPIVILICYLMITKSFSDFLSYTFLSIGTFDNSIPYLSLILTKEIVIKVLACLCPSLTIVLLIYLIGVEDKKSKKYNKLLITYCSSLPLLLIEYPISDRIHFLLANYLIILLGMYFLTIGLLYGYEKCKIKIKEYLKTVAVCFCIIFTITKLIMGIYFNLNNYIKNEKNNDLNHFKGLSISENVVYICNKVNQIEDYYKSQGKNVIVLDSLAVVIHIPMDKYLKNYDMFNKGNFGKDGEDGIIDMIKKEKNQVYLVKKDGKQMNWQNPNKITDYVKNNLTNIGEIDTYDIFE